MSAGLLLIRQLGRQPYTPVWQAMRELTDQRSMDTPDQCWIVEHDPVFTQGQAGKPHHILSEASIPVVQTDRGGQVTYHGPGQLVMYWLVDLKRKKLAVRQFVSLLEQSLLSVLADFGIEAELREGAPGVYVADAKIASLGLRVRKGCTYHGLALNIDADLKAFEHINPCGYAGLRMVNLNDLLHRPQTMNEVAEHLLQTFVQHLDYRHTERPEYGLTGIKK